jgi:hypothetical protein
MLPIDRVRKISAQAHERFDRARSRFTVKRAQVKERARTYDDDQAAPNQGDSPEPSDSPPPSTGNPQ